jgi:hypothetical protein
VQLWFTLNLVPFVSESPLAKRPIQQLVSDLFGRHRVRRYR